MYELKTIREAKPSDRPPVQNFKDHSPVIIGLPLYLFGREGDDRMLVTSRVVDIWAPHEAILQVTTKNGSIYELRRLWKL